MALPQKNLPLEKDILPGLRLLQPQPGELLGPVGDDQVCTRPLDAGGRLQKGRPLIQPPVLGRSGNHGILS